MLDCCQLFLEEGFPSGLIFMAELVDFIFVIVEVCPSGLGLLGQLCVDVCEQFLVLNQFFFVHLVDIVVVDENV